MCIPMFVTVTAGNAGAAGAGTADATGDGALALASGTAENAAATDTVGCAGAGSDVATREDSIDGGEADGAADCASGTGALRAHETMDPRTIPRGSIARNMTPE